MVLVTIFVTCPFVAGAKTGASDVSQGSQEDEAAILQGIRLAKCFAA